MNKTLELKDFVYLMLACLSKERQIYSLVNKEKIIISIPINYKQVIEEILCENNGWKDKFSTLINVEEYFSDHFVWEQKLGLKLKEVLDELGKTIEYNFEFDYFIIYFTKEEIDKIFAKYPNENLVNNMRHFVGLLVDYSFTRQHAEEFNCTEPYVNAVKKMHGIYETKITNGLPSWYRARIKK